jgi:chromate transporter
MIPPQGASMSNPPAPGAPPTPGGNAASAAPSGAAPGVADPPAAVSLGQAFWYWLRLGLISFGGPTAQIAIMHQDLVEQRRWISEKRFLHALNYCMVLPGPEAQQLATYIGWLMHRTPGAIIAGGLFVLPSLALLIVLSWVYIAWGQTPVVAGVFYGIKPTVTAIVAFAAWRIASRALSNGVLWAIAVAAFVALFAFDLPFPLIIVAAALAGYLGGRYRPDLFAGGAGHKGSNKRYGAALIDDDTPPPIDAKFGWTSLAKVLAAGTALWALPMTALMAVFGWDAVFTQMAWLFTKVALLTFGGAYAVLPYVYQNAVEHQQWLSGAQMIAGLALGETTPGPLIMVNAFVGFVGAWNQAGLGADRLFAAGVLGAVVVTWFTFLPSFVFILAGAPLVEATHGNLSFTAPLSGITAAVVGVIVNLALFFAWHVLWPQASASAPFSGGIEWPALAIGVAAAIALFRFQVGVITVIAVCGAAGLALRFVTGS